MRLANVVTLRGALDMVLKDAGLQGGSHATFMQLLTSSATGHDVLRCCNGNPVVLSDNCEQPHTADTLARALASIKRRLNKDAHPKRSAGWYSNAGDRLLLVRDGMSESDVQIMACVFGVHGYPVDVMEEELA